MLCLEGFTLARQCGLLLGQRLGGNALALGLFFPQAIELGALGFNAGGFGGLFGAQGFGFCFAGHLGSVQITDGLHCVAMHKDGFTLEFIHAIQRHFCQAIKHQLHARCRAAFVGTVHLGTHGGDALGDGQDARTVGRLAFFLLLGLAGFLGHDLFVDGRFQQQDLGRQRLGALRDVGLERVQRFLGVVQCLLDRVARLTDGHARLACFFHALGGAHVEHHVQVLLAQLGQAGFHAIELLDGVLDQGKAALKHGEFFDRGGGCWRRCGIAGRRAGGRRGFKQFGGHVVVLGGW